MNERFIRISYTIIFGITLIISIITLGISASLVSKYNKDGYPPEHTGAYRDRIRLLLVASVWTTFFGREYHRLPRAGAGGVCRDAGLERMGKGNNWRWNRWGAELQAMSPALGRRRPCRSRTDEEM